MYRTIICGIGMGSRQTANRLLRRAAALVDDGGTIIVMHVVENIPHRHLTDIPEEFETAAIVDVEQKLASCCKELGIPARIEVRIGVAASLLVSAARETAADLILLSSHVADITDYVFSSIVEKVVRHAGCSVLIDRRLDHHREDAEAQAEDVALL
ncbi:MULTISPECIES: universal stress protein [Rhizobium]|uniref:universal stress protein n=1 Tax=Rhizobium TaxID=379 RepID=UPI001107552B|nr:MULTISPECIES: universal stress protein [Rhizobium]MBX4870378.1 universal stress protein [Rhizobium bangladeshense]MBX4886921.1 universal stress protein [Rhizobium bangladeshense]MBX4893087.1 universal stress protein [Rhizobium bangladeshense]MBX4905163.1 universal stress protein [Rhizobium bangladeshense]MBX4917197.1 universal stress protein [Rhizobium bangladeshense]